MEIYVVIVTYNGLKWLDKCLGSLFKSSVDLKVIVVDNSSTDNTVQFIRNKYPKTILLEAGENLGFGRANNLGIRYALKSNPDYLFLLNQDAWVDPNTVEGLIKVHKGNRDYGILSPVHLNATGTSLDHKFSIYCGENDCPAFLSDSFVQNFKPVYQVKFVNAALWLISKECFEVVGLFDPLFPHYGEDLDYINRVHKHGFKVGICAAFVGYHDREYREFSITRHRKMNYLGLLCILKDVNHSFFKSSLIVLFSTIKSILKNASKFNFKECYHNFTQYVKLCSLSGKVLSSRKEAISVNAYINSK